MGEFDVESLLRNGYWPNSRARDPNSMKIPDTHHKSSYVYRDDRATPRRVVPYDSGLRKPPPPSVEDEHDALAKEAGSVVSSVPSEEPTNRGDPDQYPILVPVDEQAPNPERRFVLVPQYEANTGRKYGSAPDLEDKPNAKQEKRPETEHSRSRPADLPPIVTDGGNEGRTHDARQARSATTDSRNENNPSPRVSASSQAARERLLSPEVIEHATNGRDQSYYRGGTSPDPQGRNRNRSAHPSVSYNHGSANNRGYSESEPRSSHSPSTTAHKRRTSELPQRSRYDSGDRHESSRQFADGPSSSSNHRLPPLPRHQSDRDSGSQHSSATRSTRAPPQYSDTFYSSEDESRPHVNPHRRTAMPEGSGQYLTTPVESRSGGRRKSGGQSTSRSPRPAQASLSDPYSSSSSSRSATFPRESMPHRDDDRAGGRTRPRASTRGSLAAAQNAIPVVAPPPPPATASASNSNIPPADHRRSQVPPSPKAASFVDPRAQPTWPPPKFEPPPSSSSNQSDAPISSYRRYSTEVKTGELPDIPHCPRTRPEAGHMDWLTLPRCDNFNICPSCYDANFASTEFAHDFVPMPFRPRDRPLACDFGASEFYRIAWLFTRKYRRRDLGLVHSLTRLAAAQGEPCAGHRETSRLWYSVRDPSTARPVEGFTVCDACAAVVEALLPGLTGLFVPADSPAERTRGVCALHHDRGHDRGRFLLYFDAMEAPENRALAGPHWRMACDAPMVVCPECFTMVVQPLLEDGGDRTVAGALRHAPGPVGDGLGCMLFSDRMRSVFGRAVRRRDLSYLDAKVAERIEKKQEYDARCKALQRRGPRTQDEEERIVKEWKRYE